jgi:hypothetical protein
MSQSSAWKDLERRVCRALGAERRPSVGPGGWARGTDDDGNAPFAVEVKRTTRFSLRHSWIEQARRNAKATRKPWLLVIGEHRSPRPIAVLDFYALVQLAQEAGRLGVVAIDPRGGSMNEVREETTRRREETHTVAETPTPTPTPTPPDEPAPGPDTGDDEDDGGKA